ncbi:MAG: hypothetical protein BWZ03_00511 [bacterium ADurb.BinA186]|nr:MAG: hypothetical protein BWZ03_00511 [bacterium ADurb.BinA186]
MIIVFNETNHVINVSLEQNWMAGGIMASIE